MVEKTENFVEREKQLIQELNPPLNTAWCTASQTNDDLIKRYQDKLLERARRGRTNAKVSDQTNDQTIAKVSGDQTENVKINEKTKSAILQMLRKKADQKSEKIGGITCKPARKERSQKKKPGKISL